MTAREVDPAIVVVGAGLAGLTAAYRLASGGRRVTVIEARARVGGRTWSVEAPNGEIVEQGGEWICEHQSAILGLAAELGVNTVPAGLDFAIRDALGRPPIPLADHAAVARAVRAAAGRLTPTERETTSVGSLFESVHVPADARAVLRSRLEGSAAIPLSEVGVDELEGCFGVHSGRYVRMAAGNQRLAEAMARTLDVRLGTRVVAINRPDSARHGAARPPRAAVAIRLADGAVVEADAVVVAVPLPILAALPIDPAPPIAFERLRMGLAAKAWVPTAGGAPLVARQSLDVPVWAWNGTGPDGAVRRVLTSFAGGSDAIAAALGDWRERLGRLAPEVPVDGEVRVVDWSRDPLALGAHSAVGPGDATALEAFDRAHGPVVFAGEHTNGSGTMDGAVRSGEGAARLVQAMLAG